MQLPLQRPLRTLSKEVQLKLRRVQVDLLWRNAPVGYIANILVALVVLLTLSAHIGTPVRAWFAGVVTVTVLRVLFSYAYFSRSAGKIDPYTWGNVFIALTAMTGMTWGMLGSWLFPLADPYGQSLIVVVVVGITAGAVVTTAFLAPAYYVYLGTAVSPYLLHALGGDARFDVPLAMLVLIYSGFMVTAGRRTSYNLVNNLVSIHLLEEATRELNRAQHDQLTGLPTRTLLYDRLDQAVLHAERHHKSLAVLFVDLDGFKEVNDANGHDAGDELLRQIAQRLREAVRAGDTVARHGGDEFVLVLDDLNASTDVEPVVCKLLTQIAALTAGDDPTPALTASIGVAFYPRDGKTGAELISSADAAMYRAKQRGKNTYVFNEAKAA